MSRPSAASQQSQPSVLSTFIAQASSSQSQSQSQSQPQSQPQSQLRSNRPAVFPPTPSSHAWPKSSATPRSAAKVLHKPERKAVHEEILLDDDEDNVFAVSLLGSAKRKRISKRGLPASRSDRHTLIDSFTDSDDDTRSLLASGVSPAKLGLFSQQDAMLWVDKYKPASEAELAVHKRKISDVKAWIENALLAGENTRGTSGRTGRVLMLTGPSGSGKTATVRVLSRVLDAEIVEWENPVNSNSFGSVWDTQTDDNGNRRWTDYVPVLQPFVDFLGSVGRVPRLEIAAGAASSDTQTLPHTQSSAFPGTPQRAAAGQSPFALLSTPLRVQSQQSKSPFAIPAGPASTAYKPARRRKIVLVEDWPPLSTPAARAQVQHALKSYMTSPSSVHPLILILSDVADVHMASYSSTGYSDSPLTLRSLITPALAASPSYTHIVFNPVAPTYLTKALNRLADLEYRTKRHARPTKDRIEWTAKAACGDIRHAVHLLQFNGVGSTTFLPPSSTAHQTASRETDTPRDETVSIFSAIGRLMYNKRLGPMAPTENMLSPIMRPTHSRSSPIEIPPETMLDHLYVDPGTLLWFAHQNAIPAYSTVDELCAATAYMSDADVVGGDTGAMIGARGLLFAHRDGSEGNVTQRVMSKPDGWAVTRRATDNRLAVIDGLVKPAMSRSIAERPDLDSGLRLSHYHSTQSLWTEIVPYLGVLSRAGKHPDIRTMPVHDKTVVAAICGYGPRSSLGPSLLDDSYVGGIEYLDAIEDTAQGRSSTSSAARPPAWKALYETLALTEDDIEDF
ncbi:Rad17 cell cycle checkpoint protein-domain-containing protein [Entophlyctis helioformis]|nr:Rad17 cell cycle checkpoint protein-domain-containing protein [Entophlyctis helioformis]